MLIGAHVGSLKTGVDRGIERECDAIQIFNQSPRMWKPPAYNEDEHFAPFRSSLADSGIQAVLIHGVYLINCASEDPALCEKSLDSLVHSLAVGDAIGAHAVVLHAGSALKGDVGEAIRRTGPLIAEALARTEGCPLHLENTAGAGGTLGRSFAELGAMLEAAGGDDRLGVCLDSCHLFASGYDVRTEAGMDRIFEELDAECGRERLGSLHVNDSVTPLGSNRDRHAALGEGQIGEEGIARFLSDPRLEGLPAVFEGPGVGGKQVEPEDIRIMRRLREAGLAARTAA